MMIRPVHLRMARAALGWSLKDLSDKADVNLNTISRYEAGKQVMSGTLKRIEEVFEAEGIIFIADEGGLGPGVRLRKQLMLALPETRLQAEDAKSKSKRRK
jgi:transcriptional regulator with XRE-family HTH domain